MAWLVLEDNPKRTEAFQNAAKLFGKSEEVRIWRIAAQMIQELPGLLPGATLLSLDHDLYKQDESDPNPGCGRDVANFLARQKPLCPVIIHSTNTDAAWGMHNELTSAGWEVEIIHHLDEADWIEVRWLALAQKLTAKRRQATEHVGGLAGETMKIRRVTTGHDARGKAVFVSDTEVEGDAFAQMPGAAFHRLWGADQAPKLPDSGSPPVYSDYFPPLGGFRFMTFTVAPGGQARLEPEERRALYESFKSRLPGLAEHMERNSPGMHTTDTIDFEYIVSGEVWL